MPNNVLERTVRQRGPRLAAARRSVAGRSTQPLGTTEATCALGTSEIRPRTPTLRQSATVSLLAAGLLRWGAIASPLPVFFARRAYLSPAVSVVQNLAACSFSIFGFLRNIGAKLWEARLLRNSRLKQKGAPREIR